MSKETQNSRYKLREFEWFQMETRVRQMVQDLITPFSKKVFQTMSSINSLKFSANEEANKLEQLRKIVTDDPANREIDIFKSIDKKQNELQLKMSELRNLVGQTEKIIQKRFEVQDKRLQESKEIIMNNMKLKSRISEEIMEQNNSLQQFRLQAQSQISDFSKTLVKAIRDQQDDIKGVTQAILKLTHRIDLLEDFKKTAQRKFESNGEQHLGFHTAKTRTEDCFNLVNAEIQKINNSLSYTKKLANYVKELQEKTNKQDFQLQHLSPLVTQAQISDTLFNIMPVKFRRRLLVYDHQKFSKMNKQVLQSDFRKATVVFNGMGLLESSQKRTAKQIIDIKRKKLIAGGIDIDNLTYEVKERYYKEVNLQQDCLDDEQQTQMVSGVDKDEVQSIVQEMMELGRNQMAGQISLEFQDSRKYIESLEEQLQHNFEKFNQTVGSLKGQLNGFRVEQTLRDKYSQKRLGRIAQQNESVQKGVVNLKEHLSTFIKFCSLVNHLQIQDELDKQSISLFGIKQTFNEEPALAPNNSEVGKNIIDFKKECFSCCGFPASTMAAFKMACLTYAPSSINLQNRSYRREEILEMSTSLLHQLKCKLASQPNNAPSQTPRQTVTKTQESQHNIFLYSNAESQKESKQRRDYQTNRSKRVTTANTQIRTSTRLPTSVRTSKKKDNSVSILSSTFNQQNKKHSSHLW